MGRTVHRKTRVQLHLYSPHACPLYSRSSIQLIQPQKLKKMGIMSQTSVNNVIFPCVKSEQMNQRLIINQILWGGQKQWCHTTKELLSAAVYINLKCLYSFIPLNWSQEILECLHVANKPQQNHLQNQTPTEPWLYLEKKRAFLLLVNLKPFDLKNQPKLCSFNV